MLQIPTESRVETSTAQKVAVAPAAPVVQPVDKATSATSLIVGRTQIGAQNAREGPNLRERRLVRFRAAY